jgi:hypothetical protein
MNEEQVNKLIDVIDELVYTIEELHRGQLADYEIERLKRTVKSLKWSI